MPEIVESTEQDLHDQQDCDERHDLLLHRAKHAVVVKELAEQLVPYRHRETKAAAAQVVVNDAGPARQEPRRQRETPGAKTPAEQRQAFALDVVARAVET